METTKLQSKEQPGNATVAYESKYQLNERKNGEPLRVLTESDWEFWKHNGYVIIHHAVPMDYVEATAKLIWDFEEKDPNDRETWYTEARREIRMKELTNSGMVELYQHQLFWNNRQYPKVYNAFADIWGMEKLWVTIDRANLNFPIRPGFEFKGFIHWDIDTSLDPRPVNVQGVLALSDTDDNTGGFQCIPELYRTLDEWIPTQPADRDPFKPDTSGFEIVKVNMQKGDLLIFNSLLAHGIRPNVSDRPRIAQYISMSPAEEDNQELINWRVNSWKNQIAPEGYAFPGDPREWEKKNSSTAVLSELGEKLLGSKKW